MKAAVEEAGSKADKAQRECDRFITLLSSARKETETERAAKERAEEVIAALRLQLKAKDDIERQLFLVRRPSSPAVRPSQEAPPPCQHRFSIFQLQCDGCWVKNLVATW